MPVRALACPSVPTRTFHGKEGVVGSSPTEGSAEALEIRGFRGTGFGGYGSSLGRSGHISAVLCAKDVSDDESLLRSDPAASFQTVGLRQEQVTEAVAIQDAAAHDPSEHVRVVAGPGTGKSATIEKRVCHLLESGVPGTQIAAISFTRAAARDLEARIRATGAARWLAEVENVAVSTLHALALRALRRAVVLSTVYPADPAVLQTWELRNIFDATPQRVIVTLRSISNI